MARFIFAVLTFNILFVNSIFATRNPNDAIVIRDEDESWDTIEYDDKPRVFNWRQGTRCPAQYFYLDCNSCRCIRGTKAACSRMGCGIPQIQNYANGMECPAGRRFYSNCNNCTCHRNGKSARCTKKRCPKPYEYYYY